MFSFLLTYELVFMEHVIQIYVINRISNSQNRNRLVYVAILVERLKLDFVLQNTVLVPSPMTTFDRRKIC